MDRLRTSLFLTAYLLASPVVGAETGEPPVAGRPANFSGAIGSRFRVQMRASPRQLQAEEPLVLTVSVTGTGNLQEIQRPDLRRLPRFDGQFHIDHLAERYLPAEPAREFDYRLRPRTAGVKEIPPLPFVYFNPKIQPAEKGYLTTLAPAVPLTVQPRAKVSPARVEGGAPAPAAPASVYQLVEGSTVLRHEAPFELPGPFALAALLVAPPLVGGLWYFVWQRRYPDLARQAHKRRSRAAQQALKALQRAGKHDPLAQAEQAETILANYLHQRFDLLPREPTPAEVAHHLEQAGSSPALASAVARFFADCDAVRFAPGFREHAESPTATATGLLLALEEEPWPSPQL